MIAGHQGIVAHLAHDVHHLLTLRERTLQATLHQVARTDHTHVGGIGRLHIIAQLGQLGKAAHLAVRVIIMQDHDGLVLFAAGHRAHYHAQTQNQAHRAKLRISRFHRYLSNNMLKNMYFWLKIAKNML